MKIKIRKVLNNQWNQALYMNTHRHRESSRSCNDAVLKHQLHVCAIEAASFDQCKTAPYRQLLRRFQYFMSLWLMPQQKQISSLKVQNSVAQTLRSDLYQNQMKTLLETRCRKGDNPCDRHIEQNGKSIEMVIQRRVKGFWWVVHDLQCILKGSTQTKCRTEGWLHRLQTI